MSKTTPATVALGEAGVEFSLCPYDYDPDAPRIGLQAASALGRDPEQVFKTLMVELDGKPACVVAPSDAEVSMKKLAAALGGKSAQMMKPVDAERLTGMKVGGKRKHDDKMPGAVLLNALHSGAGLRVAPGKR